MARLLIEEERLKGPEQQTEALSVWHKKSQGRKKMECYNCGRHADMKKDCRAKKKESEGSTKGKPEEQKCSNCGKAGHVKKDCWSKKNTGNDQPRSFIARAIVTKNDTKEARNSDEWY